MTYNVDDDMPLPNGRATKYPWYDLTAVGKSFFVPGGEQRLISSGGRSFSIRHKGIKFTVRQVVENGVEGVRVWRIE